MGQFKLNAAPAGAAVLMWFSLLSAGCGTPEGQLPTYRVEGSVLLRGEPAVGAAVVMRPDFEYDPNADPPRGVVDEEGRFTLSTYGQGDGAPAGTYRVAILGPSSAEADEGAERFSFQREQEEAPDPYAPYRDPDKSGLVVTIPEERTTLDPFELE